MTNSVGLEWTVLIVDDEQDNREVAERVLRFFGAKVHVATNGIEALELLSTLRPTIILLDLSMPVMDGWETLRRIRNQPETAAIPVMALTAHAMTGDRERILQAGFDNYVAKPFRFDTLLDEIKGCLNREPVASDRTVVITLV